MSDIKRYLKLDLPLGQSAFLWGPRKAGKSTFLREQYPSSPYYDLLDSSIYLRFLQSPYALREELALIPPDKRDHPVIIDEVQKVPLLLDEVHGMIESMKPMSFILCGSSTRKLRKSGANFLGGRAWRYTFSPLVYPELPEFDLIKIFKTGLLPSHYLNPTTVSRSIQSYITDYLIQEIQSEGSVRNLRSFSRFLEIMVYCHGEIINYVNIATDCGIDAKTVKGYFEILQDMLLGTFVHPFSPKSGRQIISAHPKFYFFDVGIANQMAHRKIEDLKGVDAGRAFEHYIFYELDAYNNLNLLDFPIHFWRTRTTEVDFILGDGEIAIESKMTTIVQKRDIQGLLSFKKHYPESRLYIVSLEPRPRLMTVDGISVHVLPIQAFLQDLWQGRIWSK